MSEQKVEIKEPTRTTLVKWVVDFVKTKAPAAGSTVPREEVANLTGLEWESEELRFVLIEAKRVLYRGRPAYEFQITEAGLYVFTEEERVAELSRRQREAKNRHREVLASAATIDPTALGETARRDLDHAQRTSLHLYEQAKRAARSRWLRGKGDAPALEGGDPKKTG